MTATPVYIVCSPRPQAGKTLVARLLSEFLLLKERLLAVLFAVRHGNEGGRVHQLEVRLQGSADWNDLWKNITTYAEQLGLKSICLDVNAPAVMEGYHARWGKVFVPSEAPAFWRVEMPLEAYRQVVGRLEVAGQRDGEAVAEKLALIAKIVAEVELAVGGLTRSGPACRTNSSRSRT